MLQQKLCGMKSIQIMISLDLIHFTQRKKVDQEIWKILQFLWQSRHF